MNKTEFVQFSKADSLWWVYRPVTANGKTITYTKVRLATDDEVMGEMPKSTLSRFSRSRQQAC